MDNELKTIRRELKLREDQLRQLERETQVRVAEKRNICRALLILNDHSFGFWLL